MTLRFAADPTPLPLGGLRRIRRPPAQPGATRCELCAAAITEDHGHISDLDSRSLLCACRPCSLLFTHGGAAGGRYRTVPERYLAVTGFELSLPQWEALQIPVAVAFFLLNSATGEMAGFYPSPAGATECLLPLDAWKQVEVANPVVGIVLPDVEAVLIRCRASTVECFIVPIDSCYELVGHLRRVWRGFDGGREGADAITEHFAGIQARVRRVDRFGDG